MPVLGVMTAPQIERGAILGQRSQFTVKTDAYSLARSVSDKQHTGTMIEIT
jgi:hypothetical protein